MAVTLDNSVQVSQNNYFEGKRIVVTIWKRNIVEVNNWTAIIQFFSFALISIDRKIESSKATELSTHDSSTTVQNLADENCYSKRIQTLTLSRDRKDSETVGGEQTMITYE